MRDLVYIYDKEYPYERRELGEIQSDFNLSFVIDGTKDSAKLEVFSYSKQEIEPQSIIKHEATNSWFVVGHDKVESIVDDSGYLYRHNLEVVGARELLNARDLTDCGFNSNKYTVQAVIERLFSLSNFEFQVTINSLNSIDLSKKVDYVKTFENYTPLSALRELLDGYNCSFKLSFNEKVGDNGIYLDNAILEIVSKTGNTNKAPINDNVFNGVQELATMDKSSFGTSVISNAENVISTKAKTYPTSGLVKATGTAFKFGADVENSIVVRLPSNIYRVNWVDIVKSNVKFLIYSGDLEIETTYNPCDDKSIQMAYKKIRDKAYELGIGSDFEENITVDMLKNYGKRRFYYEDNYDAINKNFVSNNYIPIRRTWTNYDRQTVLSNSEMKSNVEDKNDVFYFERGKDVIEGFSFFGEDPEAQDQSYNAVRFVATNEGIIYTTTHNGTFYRFLIGDYELGAGTISVAYQRYYLPNIGFVVNYVPMSDIKVKVDNSGTRRDSQLYNQNGKLTDSVALSKSLLSYSKEIESDSITKYGTYYYKYENNNGVITRTHNIPSVGDLVSVGNDIYVINNASMDFAPNDTMEYGTTISYIVQCEFTMSKNIATKSLMVNPNTNIRDYGIPQNFNVNRKQLYRDFYELTHNQESTSRGWKLPLDRILNVSNEYKSYQEHTAVMRLEFDNAYGGTPSNVWYYQLESTTFMLKKSIYEIIDFKDNNIIGYGSQNVWSGFDIRRLLGNTNDLTNTPISYVDNNGEVKAIDILFSTNKQLTEIYQEYMDSTGEDFSNSSYGAFYSCFIPSDIYLNAIDKGRGIDTNETTYGYEFAIFEPLYNKDAIEVPVFEYACQLDDTKEVIIGSNVFDNDEQDSAYLYTFVAIDKNKYNDNNYSLNAISQPVISGHYAILPYACKMAYENGKLVIRLYESITYNLETHQQTGLGNQLSFDTTKDLMIVRYRFLRDNANNYSDTQDLMFIIRDMDRANISSNTLSLCINHYLGGDDYVYIVTDNHSIVTISLKRDNEWVVEDHIVDKNDSYTITNCLPTDMYVYTIEVDNGYYLDHIEDAGSGTLENGPFVLNVVTKQYCTFVFHKNPYIDRAVISINGIPLYTLSTNGESLSLPQGLNYSYQVYAENGYTITSGGSGSGVTRGGTIDINAYVTLTLTLTANKWVYRARVNITITTPLGDITTYSEDLTYTNGDSVIRKTITNITANSTYSISFDNSYNETYNSCHRFDNNNITGTMDNNKTINISNIGKVPYLQTYKFNVTETTPSGNQNRPQLSITINNNGQTQYETITNGGTSSSMAYVKLMDLGIVTQQGYSYDYMSNVELRAVFILPDGNSGVKSYPYYAPELSAVVYQYKSYYLSQNEPDELLKLIYPLP